MRVAQPKLQRNFQGLDQFIWWIGVVEDRKDPLKLGRCRCRCFGWHREDKVLVPTEHLPWAIPEKQLDNGRSVVGPLEGDFIRGYFLDGILAQQPVMVAIIPGGREKEADPSKGFNDPRSEGELLNSPRDPLSFPVQHDDGSGSDLFDLGVKSHYPQNEPADPNLRYVDGKEVITNRLERNEHIDQTIVQVKKDNIAIGQTDIPTAEHLNSGIGTDVTSAGTEWTEAETPYATVYPYNHAYWSESGHILEVDDTPGAERLHTYHRSGTFKEIHPKGTTVEKIVDDELHINLKNRYDHVEAASFETVDWNKKVFINKDNKAGYNYDVTMGSGSDYNVTLHKGNHNKYVMEGDENTRISHNRNYLIENDQVGHVLVDRCVTVQGDDVLHVFGNGNVVIHEDSLVRIYGNSILTIDGNADIKVKGNSKTEIDGDAEIRVKGDSKTEIDGDAEVKIKGDGKTQISGDAEVKIKGNAKTEIDGSSNTTILGDKFETILGSEYKLILQNQFTSVAMVRLDAVGLSQERYTGGPMTDQSEISIDIVSPILLLNHQVPGTASPIIPFPAIPIIPPPPTPVILSSLGNVSTVAEAELIKVKLPEQGS